MRKRLSGQVFLQSRKRFFGDLKSHERRMRSDFTGLYTRKGAPRADPRVSGGWAIEYSGAGIPNINCKWTTLGMRLLLT